MRPLSLKGHDRALTRVRLNRDGDLLFSASKGKNICVWFVDNGERIGTYDGHNGVVWDIDVTWDTKSLVSASGDQHVMVWDVETGVLHRDIDMSTVARSISLSYSGNLVAVTTNKFANSQPSLRVMDLRVGNREGGGVEYLLYQTMESQSDTCLFSNLDNSIVIGCADGGLAMYDLRKPGDAVNFNHPHNYNITDLQISNDQGFIISASADKTAQLHNARNLEPLKKYKSGRPVNSAAISPVKDHIVLGGGEEARTVTQTAASSGQFEAKLYHMVYEEEFARFKGHFGPINSITFNPTGNVVISGGEDGYVRIQELDQEYLDFDFDY